jgi:hypothetical protein
MPDSTGTVRGAGAEACRSASTPRASLRRRVTGGTKTECIEAMTRLREELARAPKSSRKYTVKKVFEDWLAAGLPGRSDKTRDAYRSATGPLVERSGTGR